MNQKVIPLFLLGLSLCCFFQSAQAACVVKLYKNQVNNLDYIYYERDFTAPFTAYGWQDPVAEDVLIKKTFSSLRGFQASGCVNCFLTVFTTNSYNGKTQAFNLNEVSESGLQFCAKSIMVQCPTVEPEEEEEGQEEEEEGEFYFYQKLDPSVYNDQFYVDLRDEGISQTLTLAASQGTISSWPSYTVVETRSIEKALDYDYIYRYEVIVQNHIEEDYYVNFEIINDPASAGPKIRTGAPYNYVSQI